MQRYIRHATRYLDGDDERSTGLSLGKNQNFSFSYPRYDGDRNPGAQRDRVVFYTDRRTDAEIPDHDMVMAALQRNIGAAMEPLIAATDQANQTADTAGDATTAVLGKLTELSADSSPSYRKSRD
jgi:hypothetical protein